MEKGNSVAIPEPINEAPGLNSMFVFGENMQAALGLNHQVAFGNNQQICVNPAGLLANLGMVGGPMTTGLLGGDAGGNMQLTFGANVALTVGQAFEMNLGPDKIQIDGDEDHHATAFTCCKIIAALIAVYAIGYPVLCANTDYAECGTYTLIYQEAVNACLGVLMVYEMVTRTEAILINDKVLTLFGVTIPAAPAASPEPGKWPAFGTGLALGAAISVPLLAAVIDDREKQEKTDSEKPADP